MKISLQLLLSAGLAHAVSALLVKICGYKTIELAHTILKFPISSLFLV